MILTINNVNIGHDCDRQQCNVHVIMCGAVVVANISPWPWHSSSPPTFSCWVWHQIPGISPTSHQQLYYTLATGLTLITVSLHKRQFCLILLIVSRNILQVLFPLKLVKKVLHILVLHIIQQNLKPESITNACQSDNFIISTSQSSKSK